MDLRFGGGRAEGSSAVAWDFVCLDGPIVLHGVHFVRQGPRIMIILFFASLGVNSVRAVVHEGASPGLNDGRVEVGRDEGGDEDGSQESTGSDAEAVDLRFVGREHGGYLHDYDCLDGTNRMNERECDKNVFAMPPTRGRFDIFFTSVVKLKADRFVLDVRDDDVCLEIF